MTATVLAAVVVGILGVARATRLVTADAYPPAVWARTRWVNATGSRRATQDWAPLLECPFCFAPYAAAVNMVWAVWSGAWDGTTLDLGSWGAWWWLVNVWAAVSYAAAMVVVRDEPPAEEE